MVRLTLGQLTTLPRAVHWLVQFVSILMCSTRQCVPESAGHWNAIGDMLNYKSRVIRFNE